jgi:hypothetical protein
MQPQAGRLQEAVCVASKVCLHLLLLAVLQLVGLRLMLNCCCCCCCQVGHAGTLDPAATGLLIICTGAGTKSIEGFMAAHKEYSGTLKLGEGTPSLDAETAVEERLPWEHITGDSIMFFGSSQAKTVLSCALIAYYGRPGLSPGLYSLLS